MQLQQNKNSELLVKPLIMAEEHRNRGDEIISGRIRLSTRKTYDCKFGHFNEFMKQNHEEHFIGEKLLLQNVKAEEYKEFFAFISVKKEKGPFSAEVIPMQYNSYKYVESYSNAIKNSFRNEGSQIPADCEMMLTNFFRGYSRKVADLKQNGEMPLEEGKSPLSFDGYQYIARKAMGAKKIFSQSTFCWVFIVLCWNLMARSASVSAIMFEHIHCMCFTLCSFFVCMQRSRKHQRDSISAQLLYSSCADIDSNSIYTATTSVTSRSAIKYSEASVIWVKK